MGIEAAVEGPLAGEAAERLISRVERELVRRGRGGRSLAEALAGIHAPQASSTARTGPLEEPPANTSRDAVLGFLAGPEARAIARHLVAVEIVEGGLRAAAAVRPALRTALRDRFPAADVAAMNRYAELLFTRLRHRCVELVSGLRAVQKDDTHGIDWAGVTLARTTVDSLDAYLAVLSRPGRPKADERAEWTRRYREAFSLHEEIPLPDLGNRRRIHYSEIFVEPRLADGSAEGTVSFAGFLDAVDRTVLLGDPGAGKSTSSALSASLLFRQGRAVPFYVVMREVDFTTAGFSLTGVIEGQLSHRYQIKVPDGLVEELLLDGSALLLFDGLDEVPSESVRRRSSEIIETASRLYPLSRVLATSRIVGYNAARLSTATFHEYRICPFDDGLVLDGGEVRAYVAKWFAVGPRLPEAPERVADVFMRESASVPDLRCNPLLLAYICVLYRGHRFIPRSRAQLYRKCAELLLTDWDNFQGLPVDSGTDLDTVRYTLAALAYRSITDPQWSAGMPEADVKLVATAAMADESVPALDEARRLADELVGLCRGRAWIFTELGRELDGSGIFGFTHQSLQEYFGALHLARNSGTPELLADHLLPELTGGRWEILAQICMNLADEKWAGGSTRVVTRLLERGRTVEGDGLRTLVEFMARWLEVVKISVPTMRLVMKLAVDSYLSTGANELATFLSPSGPYPEAAWAAFREIAEERLDLEADQETPHSFPLAWLVTHAHRLPGDAEGQRRVRVHADPVRSALASQTSVRRIASRAMRRSSAGWALALYTGTETIRTLARPEARQAAGPPDATHSNVLSVMIDTAGIPYGLGPLSPAAWIFDVLGAPQPDVQQSRRALTALGDLTHVLGNPMDTLVNLDAPRLDSSFLDYWNATGAARCDRVFRTLYAGRAGEEHSADAIHLTGLLYLCMGLVEIFDDAFAEDVRAPLSMALLLGARRRPEGNLDELAPRLSHPARRFVENWAAGHSIWTTGTTYVS
ncbi:NACHT domain-containing protein [Streptomyces sp. NPDC055912]|uniref:NACHT domain-containing protein n=1 Tax=Streptomyces sp. NPDC055912 TaxID=3345660 RepID=UPI0035D76637